MEAGWKWEECAKKEQSSTTPGSKSHDPIKIQNVVIYLFKTNCFRGKKFHRDLRCDCILWKLPHWLKTFQVIQCSSIHRHLICFVQYFPIKTWLGGLGSSVNSEQGMVSFHKVECWTIFKKIRSARNSYPQFWVCALLIYPKKILDQSIINEIISGRYHWYYQTQHIICQWPPQSVDHPR